MKQLTVGLYSEINWGSKLLQAGIDSNKMFLHIKEEMLRKKENFRLISFVVDIHTLDFSSIYLHDWIKRWELLNRKFSADKPQLYQ